MLLIQGVELRAGRGRCFACRNKALRQSLIIHGSVCCDMRKDLRKKIYHTLIFHEYISRCSINACPCWPYWPHPSIGVVDPQHSTIQMGLSGFQLFKHSIFKKGCIMLTCSQGSSALEFWIASDASESRLSEMFRFLPAALCPCHRCPHCLL